MNGEISPPDHNLSRRRRKPYRTNEVPSQQPPASTDNWNTGSKHYPSSYPFEQNQGGTPNPRCGHRVPSHENNESTHGQSPSPLAILIRTMAEPMETRKLNRSLSKRGYAVNNLLLAFDGLSFLASRNAPSDVKSYILELDDRAKKGCSVAHLLGAKVVSSNFSSPTTLNLLLAFDGLSFLASRNAPPDVKSKTYLS